MEKPKYKLGDVVVISHDSDVERYCQSVIYESYHDNGSHDHGEWNYKVLNTVGRGPASYEWRKESDIMFLLGNVLMK